MNPNQIQNLTRFLAVALGTGFLLTTTKGLSASALPPDDISQSARDQIAALLQEKSSRTPAQLKMESQLVHAIKQNRGEAFAPAVPDLEMDVEFLPDGRILVDIDADVTADLLALIQQGGGEVINSVPQFQAIRAKVTVAQLETLGDSADVLRIRRAVKAFTNTGSVNSQGDTTHRAILARSTFGVTGAGISVGVLSDSCDYYLNSQASGDLGPITILPGQSGMPGSGEGTAMMEIIHDLAPGSPIQFATAFISEAQFAQNILNLWTNGCHIIVDDVGYFDEPPFQDGIVAGAVNTVTTGGALYFSSAANSGGLDAGTSGTWEGDFVDAGPTSPPIGESGRVHSFGPTAYDSRITGGSSPRVDLFWSDPWGASANDYDLFVLDPTGTAVLRSSTGYQTGTQNPYEDVDSLNVGERIVIVKFSGANRFIHLSTGRARLAIATSGSTRGHSAATNAFSTAAVSAMTAYPNPFTGGADNPYETFTSDGLRHVFYNADGTAITPGNYSSTGGAIRNKPDIAAADRVSTTVPGFAPFSGTSAAAPHAAAIAALLWSANPGFTTTQMRSLLTGTALDVNPAGYDRNTGVGLVMAYQALQAAPTNTTCSEATFVTDLNYANNQSTVYAGSSGNPTPTCIYNFGHAVWYKFISPVTADITVDTVGSSFDTGLAVYTGSCGAWTQVACNDDISAVSLQSLITFSATAGTTYYILTGGYNQNSGNLVFHLNVVVPSSATLTINAADTGWYDSTGHHDAGNANYVVGDSDTSDGTYNNFFVFAVPNFNGVLTSATLLLNSYINHTPNPFETYQLHDVTTSIPTLMAGGTGLMGIFADLANGTLYGSRNITVSDSGTQLAIPLNTAFLNAARSASGGQIALGGTLSTLDATPHNQYFFGYSQGLPGDAQLQLTFAPSSSTAATDRGWYDASGYHDPINDNYYVGATNHDFFVFNVPVFNGSIINAELLVNCYTNRSPSGANQYLLRAISTPIPTLLAGGSGLVNIYNDLADGIVYSTRAVAVSESGMTAIIPLNASFIQAATTAMGNQIAIGGSLFGANPVANNEYLFAYSGLSSADVQLRLTYGNSYLVNATNRGWYSQTGVHDPANLNYCAGNDDVGPFTYHNYFIFPVPTLTGQLVNGQLLVKAYRIANQLGVNSFVLHNVSTPLATLAASATNAIGIYNDLASGIDYGGRNLYTNESGLTAGIPLNASFLKAATQAAGGALALGGMVERIGLPPSNEYVFGYSLGSPSDVQLWLGTATPSHPRAVLVAPFTHFNDGRFQFYVNGQAETYEIQRTTDLQNWDIVGTLTMTNATSAFRDTLPGLAPRYYRAREIP